MVDKSKNIGVKPIDGDNDDIYSSTVAVNVNSFLGTKVKYAKNRPPPTYISYQEFEEEAKKACHHPMKNLEIRDDLRRIECTNEEVNKSNQGLKSYLYKQIAKNFFKGSLTVSLPAYAFDPVSNVSMIMNNFRT